MARIDRLPGTETVTKTRGVLDYACWRGLYYVRQWPRKFSGTPSTPRMTSAAIFGAVAHQMSLADPSYQAAAALVAGPGETWRDVATRGVYDNLIESPLPPEVPGMLVRRPGCGSETFYPQTGPLALNAPGGAAWTFTPWTALSPVLAADFFLTQIFIRKVTLPANFIEYIVELGSSPVVNVAVTPLQALRGTAEVLDPTADSFGKVGSDLASHPIRVPTGHVLQARIAHTAAVAGQPYDVFAAGWPAAVPSFTPSDLPPATGPGSYVPTNTSQLGTVLPVSPFPNFAAYATVIAAAPAAILIDAAHAARAAADSLGAAAVQLAIGPPGAEQPVALYIRGWSAQTTNISPPIHLKAGETLRARRAGPGSQLFLAHGVTL